MSIFSTAIHNYPCPSHIKKNGGKKVKRKGAFEMSGHVEDIPTEYTLRNNADLGNKYVVVMARTFRAFEYLGGSGERVFFGADKTEKVGRACSRGKPTTTTNYAGWSILTFRSRAMLGRAVETFRIPDELLDVTMHLRKIGEHSLGSSNNRNACVGQR